jgi:hypothetical protein
MTSWQGFLRAFPLQAVKELSSQMDQRKAQEIGLELSRLKRGEE